MQPDVILFGPLDRIFGATAPGDVLVIEYVILVLVLANFATRLLAHRRHESQYEEGGADTITRHPAHIATNVLLVLTSFLYMSIAHHGGMVMSVLVLGAVITDFFEFESRKVEARRDIPLERPNGAIVAVLLVAMYAGYQALFWLIKDPWSAVV